MGNANSQIGVWLFRLVAAGWMATALPIAFFGFFVIGLPLWPTFGPESTSEEIAFAGVLAAWLYMMPVVLFVIDRRWNGRSASKGEASHLAWIFTLIAGFATFMGLAILTLLPIEAAKNRAIYGVVEQYAERLAATHAEPQNTAVDKICTDLKGISIWCSLPGGCHDVAFEAPSDRFALGFWENGSKDRFGVIWWHCYAYPSGNTTLQVSALDYLKGPAGRQVAAYALIAMFAAYIAWSLSSRGNRRSLKPWAKAAYFGTFMTIMFVISIPLDFGDDEFSKNSESVKWFVVVLESTFGAIYRLLFVINPLRLYIFPQLFFNFCMWSILGWLVGRLITFASDRLGSLSFGR